MPLYDYACSRCGLRQELLQPSYMNPAPPCKACGKPLTRLPPTSNFRLVGAGFHQNDYPMLTRKQRREEQ